MHHALWRSAYVLGKVEACYLCLFDLFAGVCDVLCHRKLAMNLFSDALKIPLIFVLQLFVVDRGLAHWEGVVWR